MALFTDTKARNITPDDKPFPHGGISGLTLCPSNSKSHGKWVLRYASPTTKKRRNARDEAGSNALERTAF